MLTRVGLVVFGIGLVPGASEAATVWQGVLEPVNGLAVLASEGRAVPPAGVPEGRRVSVSFTIDSGVISEVLSALQYRWFYEIVPSDPAALPFGNDVYGNELCSFNGAGPDGCHDAAWSHDPSQPQSTRFITNFAVGQRSLSYDLFRPAGFDRCDDPVPDVFCRSQWSMVNDFVFTVASHRPVSWTLRFSDPAAVPEPASWAMLIAGFGVIGGMMRRRVRMQTA